MLENDLGEFRLYYGSSGSKCSIAPEKLISEAEQAQFKRNPIQLLQGHRKEKTTRDTHVPSYTSRVSLKDSIVSTPSDITLKEHRSEQFTLDTALEL